MVITKTPFRISFFGGGTDFEEFYRENGGSVISTTIDKYCYVSVRELQKYFDYSNQVVYSKIECTNSVEDIEHPAVREAMKYMHLSNLRVVYDADLPARAGIGSSSAFMVGMLNAFHAMKGEYAGKARLAQEAIYIEHEMCGEAGGVQDQIAVSHGGFNRLFFDEEGFHVSPVIISEAKKRELSDELMLFFSGFTRFSGQFAEKHREQIKNKKTELLEMLNLVDEAERILTTNTSLCEFGKLLNYTWKLKRSVNESVSNSKVDAIYDFAIRQGALGGKLLGAGGGGFLLFYVEKEKQKKFLESMKNLLYVPVRFENFGTSVLYTMEDKYT